MPAWMRMSSMTRASMVRMSANRVAPFLPYRREVLAPVPKHPSTSDAPEVQSSSSFSVPSILTPGWYSEGEEAALFSCVVFSEDRRDLPVRFMLGLRASPSSKVNTAPATKKQRDPTANVTTSRMSTPLAAATPGTHQTAKSLPDSRVLGSIAMYAPRATPSRERRSKRVPMTIRIKPTYLYYRQDRLLTNIDTRSIGVVNAGSSRAGRPSWQRGTPPRYGGDSRGGCRRGRTCGRTRAGTTRCLRCTGGERRRGPPSLRAL